MRTPKLLVLVMVLLTALRIGLVLFEDPSPDEAYYELCAGEPAPAYFDGPAGVARTIGWCKAVRLPDGWWRLQAPLWALAATGACFLLLRAIGNAEKAAWAALGLNALPILNAAALRVGPELPTLTAMTLGLWCVWNACHAETGRLLWWLAAGVAVAIAAAFAYVAVAWLPAIFVFTLASPERRRVEEGVGLALLVLVPALVLGPAMAWNANWEWLPIAGGTWRTLGMFGGWEFLRSLGRLALLFSPFVLIFSLFAWAGEGRTAPTGIRSRFLFLGALPGVVLSGYFLFRGEPASLPLLLATPVFLFGFLLSDFQTGWRKLIPGATFTVAIGMAIAVVPGVLATGAGWREVALEVRDAFLAQSSQGEGLFLVADTPGLASVLGYHLRNDLVPPPGHPTVYVGESQNVSNQFAVWPSYGDFVVARQTADESFTEQQGENPFLGRDALYITREQADEIPQTIQAAFASVNLLKALPPTGGRPEPLYIYKCLDYQTQPL